MNRLCFLSCVTSLTSTRGAVVSGPDFDNHVQPVFLNLDTVLLLLNLLPNC